MRGGLKVIIKLKLLVNGDLAPGKISKENLAPMKRTLSGVYRNCELANSSKDTKQPLKSQRLFLCYMSQSNNNKNHYKENMAKM